MPDKEGDTRYHRNFILSSKGAASPHLPSPTSPTRKTSSSPVAGGGQGLETLCKEGTEEVCGGFGAGGVTRKPCPEGHRESRHLEKCGKRIPGHGNRKREDPRLWDCMGEGKRLTWAFPF